MSFPTIVFGSYEVGVGYVDGSSIPTGGLRVFIVPTMIIGPNPLDIGITYVDQFGNIDTTTATTAIAAGATSGTHTQIVLNAGDTGIRDVISVSVSGGSIGDKFNLESWNEGLGRPAYDIIKSDPYPQWVQSDPIKEITDFTKTFSSWTDFSNTIQTDIVQTNTISPPPGYIDSQFSLPIETIEPDYVSEINDFGLMRSITLVTKDAVLKKLRIELIPNQNYQYLNTNEQSTRLKWKWDSLTSQYIDTGFYKLTFDYSIQFNGTYFIFELLDKDGTVVWSRTSTGSGTGQVVSFKSLSWEFRLRCKSNYTTPPTMTDYVQVSNIIIERYKELGIAELNYAADITNINEYKNVDINSITPAGTIALAQFTFSDDKITWSDWIGPDGTLLTYFEGIGQSFMTVPGGILPGIIGYYYKWRIYLQSDGRDTPILYDLTLRAKIRIIQKLYIPIVSDLYPYLPSNPIIPMAIPINSVCPRITPGYPIPTPPLTPSECTGGDYFPEPPSGNLYTQRIYPYIILCTRQTPGYPLPPIIPSICVGGDYFSEPPTGREHIARLYMLFGSWLESVVGQVVSGYVQNVNGDTIRNALSMILLSPTSTGTTPGGTSTVSAVNPNTGLYQTFLKSVIYDKRYLIIRIGVRNITLEGAGIPTAIDGRQHLDIPYNIQFACPTIDCDFNITRKM